jgi:hypothetical protein
MKGGPWIRLFISDIRADPLQPIERALDDIGGGMLVDDGRASPMAHIGGNQLALDSCRG